ncbi:MAG: SPASM domain-containing protein [Kiloniellaceae bacterium]
MADEIVPKMIRLEASSHCQLRCPSCPTTTGAIDAAVGKGFLTAADFHKLLNDTPSLEHVELSNYGEIFLNPELLEIMASAHARGVSLSADNGVNLNSIRDDVLEGLVKYGFRSMTCSIDGASAATYARYRLRGSFDKVIANIRRINAFKKQYNAARPALVWQFIVFGHNEHEIEAARELAESLDMTFRLKLSWDDGEFEVKDKELVARATGLGVASRKAYKEKFGRDYQQRICAQLWVLPQINWDGKVLGCCRNFWGDFGGNAFRDGLTESVNSEKMTYARQMLQGRQPARGDIPCTTCEIYIGMQADNKFLTARKKPGR